MEGWGATIDAVLEGLESKDVLDVQAGAKPDGGSSHYLFTNSFTKNF